MALKQKGITWVNNFCQQIEEVCHEVEDIVGKHTIKYVENQVQNVRDSGKRIYSDVVEDLLPSLEKSAEQELGREKNSLSSFSKSNASDDGSSKEISDVLRENLHEGNEQNALFECGALDEKEEHSDGNVEVEQDSCAIVENAIKLNLLFLGERGQWEATTISEAFDGVNYDAWGILTDIPLETSDVNENFQSSQIEVIVSDNLNNQNQCVSDHAEFLESVSSSKVDILSVTSIVNENSQSSKIEVTINDDLATVDQCVSDHAESSESLSSSKANIPSVTSVVNENSQSSKIKLTINDDLATVDQSVSDCTESSESLSLSNVDIPSVISIVNENSQSSKIEVIINDDLAIGDQCFSDRVESSGSLSSSKVDILSITSVVNENSQSPEIEVTINDDLATRDQCVSDHTKFSESLSSSKVDIPFVTFVTNENSQSSEIEVTINDDLATGDQCVSDHAKFTESSSNLYSSKAAYSVVSCEGSMAKTEPLCLKSSFVSESPYAKSPGSDVNPFEIESCKNNLAGFAISSFENSTASEAGLASYGSQNSVELNEGQTLEPNEMIPLSSLDGSLVSSLESGMEDIQLNDEAEHEKSCVVDDNELYSLSRRLRRGSYKKRIREFFGRKKRVVKEYEQLGIWYGDADMDNSQEASRTLKPGRFRTSLDSKNVRASETEWEML